MEQFELHPEFYNNPILLTEEEKLSPSIVIKEFFRGVHLVEVKIHLSNLIEVALTSNNYIYLESSERGEILAFSKQLEKLVEAAKVAIFTTKVDAEIQTLINHKCVCGALNRHFCQTAVMGRFSSQYFLIY